MKRRSIIPAAMAGMLSGCARALGLRSSYGIVVDYNLLPGASDKEGITAVSDTGQRLFSPGFLRQRTSTSREGGGGRSHGGAALAKWVRVIWRTGNFDMDYAHGGWTGGTIVGDYRIEVASRIPQDVIAYASAVRGRALRLVFWLKDDGVLLAWDVMEPPSAGWDAPLKMHGGDFVEPRVYGGKIIEPGWYLGPDGRRIVIDR